MATMKGEDKAKLAGQMATKSTPSPGEAGSNAKLLKDTRRAVIKIGSALLVNESARTLRREWLDALALDIARMRGRGADVLIVSSGAIALGRQVLQFSGPGLSLEENQAAAAVGQIALARAWQEALGAQDIVTAQILLTSEDSENRRRYLNTRATLEALLKMGVVPIINENDTVATDEIRFGDNDRLAAQLAVMAGADLLVLLSDVDGIYTNNPQKDAGAKHIARIEKITPEIMALADGPEGSLAKGGMITKLQAAKTAMNGGANMLIANGASMHPISAIEEGARASSFLPKTNPIHARKNWITSMKPRGEIVIDEGAAKALEKGSSLLASGCVDARGSFGRGDAVDVIGADGVPIARGLIAYDAVEAGKILRAKSSEFEERLGYAGRGAMIHRDNLVMV